MIRYLDAMIGAIAAALIVVRCAQPPSRAVAPTATGSASATGSAPAQSGSAAPATSTTTFAVRVLDAATRAPVGARVLLFSAPGAPLHIGYLDVYETRQGGGGCAFAPDAIGSWDGLILAHGAADLPVGADDCFPSPAIPYGHYRVWAWRGIEYELWQGDVDLSAGRGMVALEVPLERAWSAPGTLAADLHVHARVSLDAMVPNPQRVVAQVAAGIQVIGLSDHDTNGDLDAEIAALELAPVVASIASSEVTADRLHVGVYPVQVDPSRPGNGAIPQGAIIDADAGEIFELLRALPDHPIIQLNHPRLRSSALYDEAGWDGIAWPPPFSTDFDAVEVLAGHTAFNTPGDRRLDDSVRDFYTLVDHGKLVAPLGNSDTHALNWVHDGTTRTYVRVDDPRVAPLDETAFVDAIRARRVVATSGPWLEVTAATSAGARGVGPGEALHARGTIWLDVTVAQARFVKTERVRITVGRRGGPTLVRTIDVPPGARTFHWAGPIDVGTVDTWVGVTADGDTPLPLELTGAYQRHVGRAGVTPFALASPILIDADGDGRWSRRGTVVPLR